MPPPSGSSAPPLAPLLALLLLTAPQCARATCIIEGDMAFIPGQQISGSRSDGALFPPVGLMCVNETHYEGETATCNPDDDGAVVRNEGQIFACSEHHDATTVCVQCGGRRRRGGALCLPPTIPVEDLDCSEFEGEDYDDQGCLVGDLNAAVPAGEVVTPEIIAYCNEDGTYVSSETRCGENWFLDVTMNFGNSCPDGEVCTDDGNGNFLCASDGELKVEVVDVEPPAEPQPEPEPEPQPEPEPEPTVVGTPVCIVGGKTYRVGEVVHVKEMECQDTDDKNVPNRYKGDAFVCMENGEVEEDEDNKDKNTCPTDRPYCVQCGPKELDIAVCHTEIGSDTATLPESCADLLTGEGTPDVDTSEPGCLSGDGVTFLRGESMGFLGLQCMPDGVSYEAVESICGDEGVFEETSVVIKTCEGVTPFCVPCGPTRRLGGAMCRESNETPPECLPGGAEAETEAEANLTVPPNTTSPTQTPEEEEPTGCLATYKANDVAEYVGVRCLSPTTFEALETVCLDDGSFNESNKVMECPADDGAPYCVQCGVGRALCLDVNVTPPECIDDEEDEGGEDDEGGSDADTTSQNGTEVGIDDNATSLVPEASGYETTNSSSDGSASGDEDRSNNSAGVSSGAAGIAGLHANVLPSVVAGGVTMILLSSARVLF